MTDTWTYLEGVSLGGKYTLDKLLGGDESDAFFLARLPEGRRVMLEAVPLNGEEGERRLRGWRVAAAMSHPNLMRILDTGRTQAGGPELAYALMEFPDDDLGTVLRERALTEDEAREALASLTAALAYLHGRGVAHGQIEPANIAAVEGAIKISSNNLRPGGRCAEDVRALGLTLYEMLTRRRDPETSEVGQIPEPFRAIVRGAVHEGWTLERITAELSPPQQQPAPPPKVSRPPSLSPPAPSSPPPPLSPPPQPVASPPPPSPPPQPVASPPPPAAVPAAPPEPVVPPIAAPPRHSAARPPAAPQPVARRRTPIWVFVAAAIVVLLVVLLARGRRTGEPQPAAERVAIPSVTPPAAAPVTPPAAPPEAARAAPEVTRPSPPPSEPRIWRVVAYTFSRQRDAANKAATINRKWAGLHAGVFSIDSGGPFMVSLGGRMTRVEALKLQRSAIAKGLPRDTFVRNFSR